MDERIYWLGFSTFSGIGPARFQKLLSTFGSAKDAWRASPTDLRQTKIGERVVKEFVDFRGKFSLSGYTQELRQAGVWFMTLADAHYPQRLLASKKAPFVLYAKGKFDFNANENQQTVAIVGTRRITQYGEQVTRLFTSDLVNAGCVIVSGLAMGVDSVAHATTIANSGKTIAVLGCGVDCCSPQENTALYNSILTHGGAVISEYPLGMQPSKGSFPSRNRIIAGLSLAVLVTEGAADSGSLITAKDAFANNRAVFAVPGPITSSLSEGPFSLINQGAKLVTSAREVLQGLDIKSGPTSLKLRTANQGLTEEEKGIVALLQNEAIHFDDLLRKTGMASPAMGTLLSLLEMKGIVKSIGNGLFCLAPE